MQPLLSLARAIDRLNDGVYAVIRWLTLLMILFGAYNALARYATRWLGVSLASNAYFDVQWYLFSLIFLLGAAYGLNRDVHVRVDVVYARLAARTRAWIDLLGTLLFVVPFSVMMLITSYPAVRNSWAVREGSPDPGGLARYPIKTVILVCFTLLIAQALAIVIRRAAMLAGTIPFDADSPVRAAVAEPDEAAGTPDDPAAGAAGGQTEGV